MELRLSVELLLISIFINKVSSHYIHKKNRILIGTKPDIQGKDKSMDHVYIKI